MSRTIEILRYLPSKYVTVFLLIKAMESEIEKNEVDKDLIADLYKFNILNLLKSEERIQEIFGKDDSEKKDLSGKKDILEIDKAIDEKFGNWDSSFSDSSDEE